MEPEVWLAVDSDGKEHIFEKPVIRFDPKKKDGFKEPVSLRDLNSSHPIWVENGAEEYSIAKRIELPKGTIKKIIGHDLTWDDEAVQLK